MTPPIRPAVGLIVDTHVHICEPERPDRPYDPESPPLTPPVDAEAMLAMMTAAGVDKLIQVTPAVMGFDNRYPLETAARYPDRIRVLGRFDVLAPDAPERLSRWPDQPGMLGIRITLSPSLRGWLPASAGGPFWTAAERYDIPVSIITGAQLSALHDVAERHPGLRLIVDHLGVRYRQSGEWFAEQDVLVRLARHPNVLVKVSALPEHSHQPYPFADISPHVRRVYDAFGPERMMWASNYPPSGQYCTVEESVGYLAEACDFLSPADLESIMGRTAARVLHLAW